MQIVKKDNSIEEWDTSKIVIAIQKAAQRCGCHLLEEDCKIVANAVYDRLSDKTSTSSIHPLVIEELYKHGFINVSKSYQEFRDYKTTYAKSWEEVKDESDRILYLGDTENANFDSSLISTKRSLIQGALTKEIYKQFYLTDTEKTYIKRGDIYLHDLRDMVLNSFNCCLFDIGAVLKNGFSMSNIDYTEPKSVLTALQVIGDITLVASAQQFGGFTLAEIDRVLLPYCKKTLNAYKQKYTNLIKDVKPEKLKELCFKELQRELEQGFQSLELKLNTVPSSRGDFAFTTITFGAWKDLSEKECSICKMICDVILETRKNGHGGKPVLFPKLVYLYDHNQINSNELANKVFNHCVRCSAQCMYPDYLSLTGSPDKNIVAKHYLETGKIISPMGCRAYLSPWQDPETKEWVTVGRCNIGAVSLNLPLIAAITKKHFGDKWKKHFEASVFKRLQVIREFFKKRYKTISETKASTNPLAFTQGGLYKGTRSGSEPIGDLVKYMTASFGITALNEFCILYNGKSIYEDNTPAKIIVKFIRDTVNTFKKEDGYLYALYGTPAENVIGVQARQYREYTGDSSFGEYFSNSFHCHVSEDITPVQKQSSEFYLFHEIAGGHIQYIRLDNPNNYIATEKLIQNGMDLGFYQGVNFDSAYCSDCGTHSTNVLNTCPKCGSKNITVISRVCGYLGYSNINGHSRMNDAKMTEIYQRKSM